MKAIVHKNIAVDLLTILKTHKIMKITKKELIDYTYWALENIKSNDLVPWKVDEYLSSINSQATNESGNVIDNEQKKKKCYMPNMCLHRGSVKVCMNCSSYRY